VSLAAEKSKNPRARKIFRFWDKMSFLKNKMTKCQKIFLL